MALIISYFLLYTLLVTATAEKLLFVHVLWRHGDRTPITTCKADKNVESIWVQGWGELTPFGMEQQIKLGGLLYDRYVVDTMFLSNRYHSSQIYVRSTDHNTTIESAVSNLIGFYYSSSKEVAGTDYPINKKWPSNYIPIPVHTVNFKTDHIANPNAYCPRQQWLWREIKNTGTYKNLRKSAEPLLKLVSTACKQEITLDNMWMYRDAFEIERKYGQQIPVSNEILSNMTELNDQLIILQNGLDIPEQNGINFKTEIPKIRGGGILWEIIQRCSFKLKCYQKEHREKDYCTWINGLKYYAYSVSDKTIAALLAALRAEQKVLKKGGYPAYTAALVVELWDTVTGPALKLAYHRNFDYDHFENITAFINGCEKLNNGYCSFDEFRKSAVQFYPGNPTKLCEDTSSKVTSFKPDSSSTIQLFSTFATLILANFVHSAFGF